MTKLKETGLAERESNSSREEFRFTKWPQLIGFVAGPLVFVICLIVPPLPDVTPVGMRTLGIFLWTVIWWLCEPVPIAVTSFLAMALLVFAGVQTVEAAFLPWSNWIILFLLAACIIGHAMSMHGLTKRIAYRMVTSRLVGGKPWRILLLFGIAAAVMSSVLSHVVTTLIFIQIAKGLSETFHLERGNRYTECLLLSIAWGSNLGILTPVGTPPNLIVIELIRENLDYQVGFVEWILACAPVFLVTLVLMFLVMRFILRPEMPQWENARKFLEGELRLGPMTRGEMISAGVFVAALILWMLPDLVPLLFLEGNREHPVSLWLTSHLDWSVSAIFAATALFLIPVNWKRWEFAMTWDKAVQGIEWSTLALIASAMAIGNAIAHPQIGLGTFLKNVISSLGGVGGSEFTLVIGVIAFTIIVGSFISNIAIVSMVGTLVLTIDPTGVFNPIALLVAVGMAASFDFALPIGTPPSAMVYATGYVRARTMFKGGAPLAVLGIAICSLLGYYMADWMIPWPVK